MNNQWTPVAVAFPQEDLHVLCCLKYPEELSHEFSRQEVLYHYGDYWYRPGGISFNADLSIVTHWMPLPDPPEGQL